LPKITVEGVQYLTIIVDSIFSSMNSSNYWFAFLVVVALGSCGERKTDADLIIKGTIYTANESQPQVEAVAVLGEKIIFAGSAESADEYRGGKTQVIELGEKIMTPGFIDGHAHLKNVGENELNLNLMTVKNFNEVVAKVREAVERSEPGTWIIGRGWHQDKWDTLPGKIVKGFPTHEELSKVSPENPVLLTHASGHAVLANRKAMDLAGISVLSKEGKRMPSGSGGEIIRDEVGNPTGIFVERASELISELIPAGDSVRLTKAIDLAFQACVRNGLTGFHDAGTERDIIELLYQYKKANRIPIRLNIMLDGWDRDLVYEWYKKGPDIDSTYRLTIRSIKLYSDGALGSRGAWLLEPYSDRSGTSGMPLVSMDTVLKSANDALKYGFQLCTHAIGDRANREILDRYEAAFRSNPGQTDHRFRIEHAQHIDPADLPRFASLGVIPAMQAIHMSSDRPWAIERLGKKRIEEGAYMWQTLLRSGARIVNGTDAPVEPLNPIPCFYASVSRKTLEGVPDGGYESAEKMTRQQALRSYTIDAAYGEFAEEVKGSIEAGKYADFTVFSRDIMKVEEDSILQTSVEMTIVGGRIVYRKK
jgi:predicted amidohydrolase YtcJ